MEKDLGLEGNQFQTAVSLLFVTYIVYISPLPFLSLSSLTQTPPSFPNSPATS